MHETSIRSNGIHSIPTVMAKQAPKEGVFIGRNSRGYFFRIKQNQHILAFAGGYNTKQNAIKGLFALRDLLNEKHSHFPLRFDFTDLTKKAPLKKK